MCWTSRNIAGLGPPASQPASSGSQQLRTFKHFNGLLAGWWKNNAGVKTFKDSAAPLHEPAALAETGDATVGSKDEHSRVYATVRLRTYVNPLMCTFVLVQVHNMHTVDHGWSTYGVTRLFSGAVQFTLFALVFSVGRRNTLAKRSISLIDGGKKRERILTTQPPPQRWGEHQI